MQEFWESQFSKEGAMWKYEPSDSAFMALELFKNKGIKNILIPGFGYGRNARLFYDRGIKISGIEISESAIQLAKMTGIDCNIHHGSVTAMPFDKEVYDGIFCFALVHLLSKPERRNFLKSCFNQLKPGGLMIFVMASKKMSMYGEGIKLSNNRFRISNGLKVYFYDSASVVKEFADFGLIEYKEIEEPVKFKKGQDPLKLLYVICEKKKEE